MRIAVVAIFLVSFAASAAELPIDQCKALYQAWLLNRAAEDGCGFNQCVSAKLAVVAKAGCSNVLTQTTRDDLSKQVLTDLRSDIQKNGQAAFCAYIKPSHEALMQDNALCTSGAKP